MRTMKKEDMPSLWWYQGTLDRVVDGDTFEMPLNCGFGIKKR